MTSSPVHNRTIVVLGESGVGKTCIVDQFLTGRHFARYQPLGADDGFGECYSKILDVDGEWWRLKPLDINATLFREQDPNFSIETFTAMLADAAGVVLLYDITSQKSYSYVTEEHYVTVMDSRRWRRSNDDHFGGMQRFGCILMGNKLDRAKQGKREVRRALAEEFASMQGFRFYEVDAYDGEMIDEAMRGLVKSIKRAERRDREDAQMQHEARRNAEMQKAGAWQNNQGQEQEEEANPPEPQASQQENTLSSQKGKEKARWRKSISALRDALPKLSPGSKQAL